jgi:hypothetical protein
MARWVRVLAAVGAVLSLTGPLAAQESSAAQATRKKLQQKVSIDVKEVGTKAFFEELNLELDKPLKFKINNASGVSNNSKVSYKGKGVSVEKVLNDMADKYEFGWVVISNAANNSVDGSIEIRKSKERGYEAGKEPKKTSRREEGPLPGDMRPLTNRYVASPVVRARIAAALAWRRL